MAEYLFRGKEHGGRNEWVYGLYLKDGVIDPMHYIISDCGDKYHVLPKSVGLWSGLKDKHYGMVFEGDIIEYNQYNETFVGVVRFGIYNTTDGNKYIGFYVDWGKWPHTEYIRNDLLFWIEEDKAVVIGNVTDNPELLEVGGNE